MLDSMWQLGQILLLAMGICLLVALVGLALIYRSMRQLRVPPEAGFFTTLRHVPLVLVVLLDLLDFGLDVFSAPLVWLVLDRMGLPALRNKAAIEALIPFSGPIPTFTLAWLAVRFLKLGDGVLDNFAATAQPRRPVRIIDME
ncbi:MAG: hypothetical protein MUD01_16375 [Chloroflexaceae bacterium]|nr:hypothetical protein [Chloroflexaceae bacterium]